MKVLVVSVASVNEPHRAAYDRLAHERGWVVDLVAPHSIPIGGGRSKHCDPPAHEAKYRLHALPMLFARSGRFIWFNGLPSVVRATKPDVVFIEQDPGSLAVVAARVFAHRSRRVAFTVENIGHRRFADAWSALTRFRGREALRDVVVGAISAAGNRAATGLACISNEGMRLFRDNGNWRKPIGVVPLGTDTSRFRPMDVKDRRAALGLRDAFVVGYFGRLVPQKGVHLLVEALHGMPPSTKLLLDMFANFEPGSYAASIMERAKELGLTDRIVTIDVGHAEVPEYMNCCDVVVLPSLTTDRWKEQFGRVLPEAMACGVPVIGSRSGNIPDMIGQAGLLVTEGSSDALAEAVCRLEADPDLRKSLASAGRARVIELFSVEAQVEGMKLLFAAH